MQTASTLQDLEMIKSLPTLDCGLEKAIEDIELELSKLQSIFSKGGEKYRNGTRCTHLQVAQPIRFSHHMLAYLEMFGRFKSLSKLKKG